MAKEPRAGRVKTRLARDIGSIRATWWFRHQLARVLRELADPRWQLVLATTPDRAVASPAFPAHIPRFAQGSGDLGCRMRRALLRPALGPVVLIGSDIPGIERAHIWQGFRALGHSDFVFGPAPDGGFWAAGAARRRGVPIGLFAGVRWSTRHALTDSLTTLNGQNHRLIAPLPDVDTGADLARLRFSKDGALPL